MAENTQNPRVTILNRQDAWILGGFLVLLLLMYGLPLITPYYFADETIQLFREGSRLNSMISFGRRYGRPINGLIIATIGNLAMNSPIGLPIIRLLVLGASYGTAVLLYYLIRKRGVAAGWTIILIILIWSQPTLQIHHGYSSLLPSFLGVTASFLAVALSFWTAPARRSQAALFVLTILLLLISWFSYQAAAFAGLALVSFYALTTKEDAARADFKKLLLFLGAFLLSMVIFTGGYRLSLRFLPGNTYPLTGRAFSFLSGGLAPAEYLKMLNPLRYLGIFEWWNYFVPIPRLGYAAYFLATGLSALLWVIIFGWSFLLELRAGARWVVAGKYFLAVTAVILSVLPVIADDFSGRQHLYIAIVPTLILTLGYALSVINRHYQLWEKHRPWAAAVGLLVLLLVVLGARANLNRGLVLPAVRFYAFVETEISRHGDAPYDKVLVINADQACAFEPCKNFFGRRLNIASRKITATNFYLEMLRRSGKTADVPIEFASELDPALDQAGILIINHQLLYELEKRPLKLD